MVENVSGWDVFWSYASPVILAALYAMCVHSLWQRARKEPAATSEKPAGVKGALLLVAAAILAGCLWRVAEALNVLTFINGVRGGDPSWAEFLRFGLPGVAGAMLLWSSCWKLTVGRTPKMLIHSLIGLWLGGPFVEALFPVFYGTAYDAHSVWPVVDWTAFALLASIYLWFAPRSRHTYGHS